MGLVAFVRCGFRTYGRDLLWVQLRCAAGAGQPDRQTSIHGFREE